MKLPWIEEICQQSGSVVHKKGEEVNIHGDRFEAHVNIEIQTKTFYSKVINHTEEVMNSLYFFK